MTINACLEAERLKTDGAGLFKEGKWEDAIANYMEALSRLNIDAGGNPEPDPASKTEEDPARNVELSGEKKKDDGEEGRGGEPAACEDSEEVEKKKREIARACHLNCAICHVKKGGKEHKTLAVTAATSALELSGEFTEAKALYWRGRALLGLGRLDDARRDLRRAANIEPGNKPVRKDLATCVAKIKARDAARRKKRAGFLTGGAETSIYDEKDDIADIKLKNELKRMKEEKEEEKKKRKDKKTAKIMPSQSAFNPGDANDYSKWDCLTDSSDEEEEEKAIVARPPAPAPGPRPSAKQLKKPRVEDDDSDNGIDDADIGDAKGYVRRADGTKTTFFHREISDREKELIGDITPKAISAPTPQASADAGATAGSKWNRAGTFEERDRSDWCKGALRRLLSAATLECTGNEGGAAPGVARVHVTKVRDVEGDAAACVISGSLRHIFDLSFALEWEAQFVDGTKPARGVVQYSDVDGPAVADSKYEVTVEYRKSVTADQKKALSPLLEVESKGLRAAVASQLQAFVAEFKASC